MKVGSIFVSLIFMIFASVIFVQAQALGPGVGGDVGAGFFPRVISVMTIVCGIVVIVQELKKNSPEMILNAQAKIALGLGAITFAYVYLMNLIGFVIITPIFIFGFLFLLQQRRIISMVLFSVALTAGVYLVFRVALNVRLATSFLGF